MNPFAQIIDILIGIYITIILLRFFLQYFRADFYNPLSQFVVKATDPLVKPLRKIVPGFGGIDVSTMLLAYLVTLFKFLFIYLVMGQLEFNILTLALFCILELIKSILMLFMFLIFVRVILSWISPVGPNPVLAVLGQISEPVVSKFRGLLPATSGFDLAPMVATLVIFFLYSSINYWIVPLLRYVG
jgi:YggT family protein